MDNRNRGIIDPKRSEAARKGAWTKELNRRARASAIKALQAETGTYPDEGEIQARLAERGQ